MSHTKSASFTRYVHVNDILRRDPVLRKELSKATVAVCRPDQTSVDFPPEVVHVVEKIHEQNLNATTFNKDEILDFAYELLITNRGPIPSYGIVLTVPIKAPTPPKAKVKVDKPAKVAAPAKVATPKAATPTPTPIKADKPAKPAKVEPVAPLKKAQVKPPKAQVTADAGTDDKSTSTKLMTYVRPDVPYVVGCAALSNLQAVLSLLEPFVKSGDSEAKDVCKKLKELIDDIYRRTVIPNDKEEPKTTPS